MQMQLLFYHLPIVSLIATMDDSAGGSPHHGIGEFGLVCAVFAAASWGGNRTLTSFLKMPKPLW